MKISDLLTLITDKAALSLQESYDNSGLLIGDETTEVSSVLLAVDATEDVVDEAIRLGCGLIIAHHPLIFKGLKRLNPRNPVERIAIKAIKNDIAIAAMHTNLDNYQFGVNAKLAEVLGIKNPAILNPVKDKLRKLVVFVPQTHAEKVRQAMFSAGAGHIGAYDSCSFNTNGTGTFKGNENTNPFVGKAGELHQEPEMKIEMVVPAYKLNRVVEAMLSAHPYEEVAYDIFLLENTFSGAGSGMFGLLENPLSEKDFLAMIQKKLGTQVLRHTAFTGKVVHKIAICGGSGVFLLPHARAHGVDAFVTADMKYHDFFEADGQLLMVDAGHFETEQFTKDLMADIIRKKIPKFAALISEVNTNAVSYFQNK
ncbi:MAG: Nif3-like dinuclear metal center hexameric protein [Bacteroidetes bacterium]|nr:Nif3-like dinuclear metal center hexameric protein [Bacteroidota bacterium]MBU1580932.1 Nif3-like dinuclear metal center hexameric protein [Bacteroidota bacterium]MBU2559072.1 Nif3-like dinuclear metal center hexameric protein [Bacteroidota bacterium]